MKIIDDFLLTRFKRVTGHKLHQIACFARAEYFYRGLELILMTGMRSMDPSAHRARP
ncbi:hypothetical protein N657DRAFT_646854 [Parathielavia appendiculata]|uniref:Uncharacterized protein n=1 Tax=Parathielavia appendiculata TaxID=2587402 RepID=A0AAN6TWY5_9PEZI|nr:hypothetical protein N657DRAFT_646854 [Parathielavia appendiculata]